MARTGPCACAAPSLFVVLLLPLLVAACPASPMSPASPYGYDAWTGTEAAAYPSPFVAAPGAAPPTATAAASSPPRAEEEPPVASEAAAAPAEAAPAALLQAEEEPPVALEAAPAAATAPASSPQAEEEPRAHGRDQEDLLMHQGGAGDGHHLQRLDHLARVLDFLGYREMASSTPLLVSSPVLASWPGPWTVFAICDAAFNTFCPASACERSHVLMEHVTLGVTVRAHVAAGQHSTTKLSTAAIGKCITASASTNGPETLWWVNGVEVSEPDLYNDGRLVIHGIKGVVRLPKRGSCSVDRSRRHRFPRPDRVGELFRDIFALAAV